MSADTGGDKVTTSREQELNELPGGTEAVAQGRL